MHVAVVLYEHIEPIELAVIGTLSMAKRVTDKLSYFTVSEHGGMVRLQNGLRVETDYAFADAPAADVVIVTGGPGWREQVDNDAMLSFIRRRHASGEPVASVCTGAMILGASGLLEGKTATTKFPVTGPEECPVTTLARLYPETQAVQALVVDEGDVITGGGVTLGIDLTLYLLERHLGSEVGYETARIMEYDAALDANRRRLPTLRHAA
ncbi:DJ-1/PfpI family protein [Cupriavidus sp. CuC1]|uniref:DJ-1/PfpI family protein n=1 Tax=Cupriavidus sp. CuC1 TaxID=3373131 RepID=UPI0037D57342